MYATVMPSYSYEQFVEEHNISKIDLLEDVEDFFGDLPENLINAANYDINQIGTYLDEHNEIGMLFDAVKYFYIPYWMSRELNVDAGEQDRPDLWELRVDNMEVGYAWYNYAKWDDTTNSAKWVIEFGRYDFNPNYIFPATTVYASNHVHYYAAQNDGATNSDKCSVDFSGSTTVRLLGNNGYRFCRDIAGKWYTPYTNTIYVGSGQKSYDYTGGENSGNQFVAVRSMVTLTTNKANKTDTGSRYIPSGNYTYDEYKQALVDDYNEDHPDDPVNPDDLPTLEELAVEFGDIDFPGIEIPDMPDPDDPSADEGCCYCEHNYYFESGAFGAGAFGAGAFADADIDVNVGAGAFGAGAFAAGAIANADIDFNGDININNDFSGKVDFSGENHFGDVTINNDYNITIDGTMLEGEEIEDIHTEIASEPVELETMPSRPKDALGSDIIKFIPDAVRAGFFVLEGFGLDTVFEDSAVIAFLFRVMRGG